MKKLSLIGLIIIALTMLSVNVMAQEVNDIKSFIANTEITVNGQNTISFEIEFEKEADFAKDDVSLYYNEMAGQYTKFDPVLGQNVNVILTGEEKYDAAVESVKADKNKLTVTLAGGIPTRNNFGLTIGDTILQKKDLTKTVSPETDIFTYHDYKDEKVSFSYRLYTPEIKNGEKVPVVISMHGSGECADRTENDNNTHLVSSQLGTAFSSPESQKKNPAYVIVPQFPSLDLSYDTKDYQNAFINIINELVENGNADENRIYAAALSMGSRIMYNMISNYPDYFAAAMLSCGNPGDAAIQNIDSMPVKLFHIENDVVVMTQFSIDSYNNLIKYGNNNAELLLYPESEVETKGLSFSHAAWSLMYSEKENIDWLFSHSRTDEKQAVKADPIIVNNKAIDASIERSDAFSVLPLRKVAESMGYTVHWNAALNQAELVKGDRKITVDIASKEVVLNSEEPDEIALLNINDSIYIGYDFFSKFTNSRVLINNTASGAHVEITEQK